MANIEMTDMLIQQRIIDKVNSKVMGLTILDRHLYVVHRKPPEIIFRYNLDDQNFDLKLKSLKIEEMVYPRGLASSDSKKSIYVIDWCKYFGGRIWCCVMRAEEIHRMQEISLDMQPYGISVSPHTGGDMRILVTGKNFCEIGKIVVYRQGEDMSLVRSGEEYLLHSTPDPHQSIMNETGNCFVCYGWWLVDEHGLAKISSLDNNSASTLKITSFGRNRDTMNFPFSLVVDGDALLALDHDNNRVLLFNQNLDFQRCILTKENGIKKPRQICIDGRTKKMYIGQEDGKILIFPTDLYKL